MFDLLVVRLAVANQQIKHGLAHVGNKKKHGEVVEVDGGV